LLLNQYTQAQFWLDQSYHAVRQTFWANSWLDGSTGGRGLQRGRHHPETVEFGEALDFFPLHHMVLSGMLNGTKRSAGSNPHESNFKREHLGNRSQRHEHL
jgi:hypothetical protein